MLSIILICCLGSILYCKTFHYTFHFDDFTYITNNYAIQNIHNLKNIWAYYPCRFLSFLSVALNYHFVQLRVANYHLFNIAVHLGAAVFVWWFTLLTFSTPALKKDKITKHSHLLSLFAGLIFVSHPLQVETVNYISQRSASMAALFYLASLCFYIKSRFTAKRYYYILSLIAAMAAMFSKENTITLPLVILLYEFYFFENKKGKDLQYLCPFLLTLLVTPLTMFFNEQNRIHDIQKITQGPEGISSIHYWLTEFRVMVTYLRLIFLPLNQNLDYDYPIYTNIFDAPVISSLLLLIVILFCAKRLFTKYKLVSFSILWFFLTLVPESSLLPEKDLIFEHRLYLPLVGFSIFLVSSVYYLCYRHSETEGRRISRQLKILWSNQRMPGMKAFAQDDKILKLIMVLIMIIAYFSILTHQRNKIWKNEFTLWNDTLEKSPHKARPYLSRGSEYLQKGDFGKAMADFNKALKLKPDYTSALIDRAAIYDAQGKIDLAIKDVCKAIEINPYLEEGYFNRGNYYAQQGYENQAILDYSKAITINPYRPQTYGHRADVYLKLGNLTYAILDYTRAIEADPNDASAYCNRGAVYASQDRPLEAIEDLNKAISLNPYYAEAYNNRGNAYFKQGYYTHAIEDYNRAIDINPGYSEAYHNLSIAHSKLNKW